MNQQRAQRKISTRKRALFFAMLGGMLFVLCEVVAFLTMLLRGEDVSQSLLMARLDDLASGKTVSEGVNEAIHPYLGWVHNPQVARPEKFEDREIPVNWLGFKDDSTSVYRKSNDTFIIGIAGGSVAAQFSWEAESLLKEKLSRHPAISERKIQIVRMALPGYKQPQQLMALNFLLTLGAEFDVLVNIDGYNETALTIGENDAANTSIVYPRSWHARSIQMVDPRDSADSLRLLEIRGSRQRNARALAASIGRWSMTRRLIWDIQDKAADAELHDLATEVYKRRRSGFLHHGPPNRQTGEALYDEVAAIWKRSSLQMHHLCQGNDCLYMHVLQPNQYVPNSKPMSQDEIDKCFDPSECSAEVVPKIYPRLQKAGQEMADRGVAFSDQTMVFSEVHDRLYVDPWCHFNKTGSLLLADAVVSQLLPLLDRRQHSGDK